MFDTRTRHFFFACLKDAAGAALKNSAPASTSKKIGSGAALKVAAPAAPQHCLLELFLNPYCIRYRVQLYYRYWGQFEFLRRRKNIFKL